MQCKRYYKTRANIFFPAHAKLNFMADKFTIGLVQMKCTANGEENLSRAIDKIREAAARGAQIISLHELFHGEYFCRTENADLSFLGKYRKMHLPDDPLYYEKFYFTPGDLGFPNFDTRYARVGVQICW